MTDDEIKIITITKELAEINSNLIDVKVALRREIEAMSDRITRLANILDPPKDNPEEYERRTKQ